LINKSIQTEIATILRAIGTKGCVEKAEILKKKSSSMTALHLRDLKLTSINVISIANCLKQAGENNLHLKSISFSYNHQLGDAGAIALAKSLPKSISEIGLVNCGISDIGGVEILKWMRNAPNLQMICMEQNNFSNELRFEFEKFKASNSRILVVS